MPLEALDEPSHQEGGMLDHYRYQGEHIVTDECIDTVLRVQSTDDKSERLLAVLAEGDVGERVQLNDLAVIVS